MPDLHGRRLLTAAQAGRRQNANTLPQQGWQARQQVVGASHLATEALADTHGLSSGLGPVTQDVEVVIETGDFKHLDDGDVHLGGQGHQQVFGQAGAGIVDQVQKFDQQVTPITLWRASAQQSPDTFTRGRIRLAALELTAPGSLAQRVWGAEGNGLHGR